MKRFLIIACTLLVLLNIGDIICTNEIVGNMNGIELNPIGRYFMDKFGVLGGASIMKAIFIFPLILVTIAIIKNDKYRINDKRIVVYYTVPLILYTAVIVYSMMIILT